MTVYFRKLHTHTHYLLYTNGLSANEEKEEDDDDNNLYTAPYQHQLF